MYLCINFSRTNTTIRFKLYEHDIVQRWKNQVLLAQQLGYDIDDPERIYSVNTASEDITVSLKKINDTIDIINSHRVIIHRKLANIQDQNTLNYLHNIFEVYHGLLNKQNHEFYVSAPDNVKQALSNLNVYVHRCESEGRSHRPRMVVTWFGLPKTQQLNLRDLELLTAKYEFGTVYLNYVEIGKTLQDFATDNDAYISNEAFKPFNFFSADFNIKFYDVTPEELQQRLDQVNNYANTHKDWLLQQGYTLTDPRLRPGNIPLAKLETGMTQTEVLDILKNTSVRKVWFE